MTDTPVSETAEVSDDGMNLTRAKLGILLLSITIVAMCGIVYELIIGTVSSYLMGNSVYQFSLTIGFFMFAMGIGTHVSRFIGSRLLDIFIYVELALALIGGLCSVSLFMLFPMAPWLYTSAMFGFIFVIGFLVGIEIPLLMRILSAHDGARKSIADVLSLDYMGALVGSVAFPLMLLPTLGLITSSFAIGLVNLSVAVLNAIWLRKHLVAPKRLLWACGAVFVLLVTLTISAGRITAFAQNHLFFDQIVWKSQTQYQNLVVTNAWPNHDFRLFIDGHLQFSEMDERRYHESLVHPAMAIGEAPKRVLVLGGGDGLAVREVLKYPSVEAIDLVDLDPEMTWLGSEFPALVKMNQSSLADPRVSIYNQDAFIFIREATEAYDRVIIDFPDPHNEAISKLYSEEFYALVLARLSQDGVIVSQSSSPYFARRTYWSIGETMDTIFPSVLSYQVQIPSFGIWGFHMGQRADRTTLTELPAGLSYMSTTQFSAAQHFPCDVSRLEDIESNSIFDPSLYEAYLADQNTAPQKNVGPCT